MIRTQISLGQEEYELAKREAARLGISLAELTRRALRASLPIEANEPWMRYCGFVESGDANASEHIDEVVYGHKG